MCAWLVEREGHRKGNRRIQALFWIGLMTTGLELKAAINVNGNS